MFDYHFMLTYPPCAGTSLGTTQHTVTIMAERATDAYRRLWTTIEHMLSLIPILRFLRIESFRSRVSPQHSQNKQYNTQE